MATAVQGHIPILSEASEPFFKLWPHRFDFLYAAHPEPDTKPNWFSETRYPLSDRVLEQGEQLYGVRFGKTTAYVMIDVDRGSAYHPAKKADKIRRIRQAMESIGLVESVICSSSDSEGLHLYFPLDEALESWKVGVAVTALMERQGLKVRPGLLEVFPNARPYRRGLPPLFNGHRLPMQNGSMILNQEFQPIYGDQDTFAQHWHRAQQRNQIDQAAIRRLLTTRRRKFAITTSAEKFLNDLNIVIQEGWTDHGQTNFILGRIAMRSYIFGHVNNGGPVLEGETLVQDIIRVAQNLPGYEDWCRHQQDIEQRATEWARSIEASSYYHYGRSEIETISSESTSNDHNQWNTQQQTEARERINNAIKDLLNRNKLAIGITTRFNQLIEYGISGSTLYKHRDCWDPRVWEQTKDQNLLDSNGCNTQPDKDSSDLKPESKGCNVAFRLSDWAEPSYPVVDRVAKVERSIDTGPNEPVDVSDLLAEIQVAQMRLDWSREDLRIYVDMNFAGKRQSQLNAMELEQLAEMLEGLLNQASGVP